MENAEEEKKVEKGKGHTGVDLGEEKENPKKQTSMNNHKFPNLIIKSEGE